MKLVSVLAPQPPSWWTESRLVQDCNIRTTASATRVSVEHAYLEDLFSFSSSIPINSRTSVDAILQGTQNRMIEMKLKMLHRFPRPQLRDTKGNPAALLGLTAATDLNHRHRVTFEGTLGSDEDTRSMSTFVSSKFESRVSWGLAITHKVHRGLTLFSRYTKDDNARDRLIVQLVHKLNEKTTLSPILAVSIGSYAQAGLSMTGHLGPNALQIKGFFGGSGAYRFSIKAWCGQID